jgi:competence protein ComEC
MKMSSVSYAFLLSFLITLFCLRFWQSAAYPPVLILLLTGVLVTAIILTIFRRKKMRTAIIAAISCGMTLGVLMAQRVVHVSTPQDIEVFADGQKVIIEGWIIQPPDVRPTVTKLTVQVIKIENETGRHEARGRVLFNDYQAWPEQRYGDYVSITGKLQKPEIIEDFDYPHYLELSGIRAIITRGSIQKTVSSASLPFLEGHWKLIEVLTNVRTIIEDRIGLVLPEPHASLLAGLLTGTRRGLSKDLSTAFRRAGLTHIVAVSGYNVTIILTLIGSLLFWIPVKKRFLPLALAAALFALFVGAGAPVVRAAIMGILGLLALSLERIALTRLLILWTAFFMLLWNPMMLWYDASFQLSFLAVIGLSEISPYLTPFLRRVPKTLAMRESFTATLAAQIATIPLTVVMFDQFSLIAPVSNLLVAPLIPLAMLLGFIATVLSFIWLPLGLLAGYYAWFVLELILKVAVITGTLPWAAVTW